MPFVAQPSAHPPQGAPGARVCLLAIVVAEDIYAGRLHAVSCRAGHGLFGCYLWLGQPQHGGHTRGSDRDSCNLYIGTAPTNPDLLACLCLFVQEEQAEELDPFALAATLRQAKSAALMQAEKLAYTPGMWNAQSVQRGWLVAMVGWVHLPRPIHQ